MEGVKVGLDINPKDLKLYYSERSDLEKYLSKSDLPNNL